MASKIKYILICICMLLCVSCFDQNANDDILFPSFAFFPEENLWATVITPYTSFLDVPGISGITLSHARKGDVMEIQGRKYVNENKKNVLWYQFEQGWLPESVIHTYMNQLQAKTAASAALQQ